MIDADALGAFIRRERLPPHFPALVETLYAPIAEAILTRRRAVSGPLVVGLCGPQGSGKTTGAEILRILLRTHGVAGAILRLDDLYLTRAERADLARRVHPMLAVRGPPGTHDVGLGERLVEGLITQPRILVPSFDKASDDRAPPTAWAAVAGPAQVVIFEGWCVGARPQTAEDLMTPVNALEADRDSDGVWRRYVNESLAGAYQSLFARIGFLAMLRPPSFATILGWRLEQERKLRDAGGGAAVLSDDAVADFVQYYERIARWLDAEMPARADIVVTLDENRHPTAIAGR